MCFPPRKPLRNMSIHSTGRISTSTVPTSQRMSRKILQKMCPVRRRRNGLRNPLREKFPTETTADDHPADLPGSKVHAYISYQRFDYAHVTITGYIPQTLAAKDRIYFEAYYTNLLVENRNTLIWLTAVLFVLCLALVIFLLCAAGHKEGVEGIHLNWVDRIPLDLYLALALCHWFLRLDARDRCDRC